MKALLTSNFLTLSLLLASIPAMTGCGPKETKDPWKDAINQLGDRIRTEREFIRQRLGIFAATGDSLKDFDYVAFDLGGTAFAIKKAGESFTTSYFDENGNNDLMNHPYAKLEGDIYTSKNISGVRVSKGDASLPEQIRRFAEILELSGVLSTRLNTIPDETSIYVHASKIGSKLSLTQDQLDLMRIIAANPEGFLPFAKAYEITFFGIPLDDEAGEVKMTSAPSDSVRLKEFTLPRHLSSSVAPEHFFKLMNSSSATE